MILISSGPRRDEDQWHLGPTQWQRESSEQKNEYFPLNWPLISLQIGHGYYLLYVPEFYREPIEKCNLWMYSSDVFRLCRRSKEIITLSSIEETTQWSTVYIIKRTKIPVSSLIYIYYFTVLVNLYRSLRHYFYTPWLELTYSSEESTSRIPGPTNLTQVHINIHKATHVQINGSNSINVVPIRQLRCVQFIHIV